MWDITLALCSNRFLTEPEGVRKVLIASSMENTFLLITNHLKAFPQMQFLCRYIILLFGYSGKHVGELSTFSKLHQYPHFQIPLYLRWGNFQNHSLVKSGYTWMQIKSTFIEPSNTAGIKRQDFRLFSWRLKERYMWLKAFLLSQLCHLA